MQFNTLPYFSNVHIFLYNIISLYFIYQAGVIMGEVNCIWPDIRRQVDDPFLVSYGILKRYLIKIIEK